MTSRLLVLPALLLSLSAVAGTILGNPTVGIVLVNGNGVYVDEVVATPCNSATPDSFDVDSTLQLNGSDSVDLFETEYCDVIAYIRWTSAGPIEAVPVAGFDALNITSGGGALTIELSAAAETATLTD